MAFENLICPNCSSQLDEEEIKSGNLQCIECKHSFLVHNGICGHCNTVMKACICANNTRSELRVGPGLELHLWWNSPPCTTTWSNGASFKSQKQRRLRVRNNVV